jgi:hypothetical protein
LSPWTSPQSGTFAPSKRSKPLIAGSFPAICFQLVFAVRERNTELFAGSFSAICFQLVFAVTEKKHQAVRWLLSSYLLPARFCRKGKKHRAQSRQVTAVLRVGELHQHPARGAGVKEGDSLPLGADPRRLVDQTQAGGPAAIHDLVQIVYRKADVVNSWSALLKKASDRIVPGIGLQELDKRLTGLEAGDSRTVGIVELHLGHSKDVAIEIDAVVN